MALKVCAPVFTACGKDEPPALTVLGSRRAGHDPSQEPSEAEGEARGVASVGRTRHNTWCWFARRGATGAEGSGLAQGAAPVTATRRRQTQPCSHQEPTPARNPSVPGPLGRPTALSTHLHHGPVSLGTPSRATPDF